MASSGKGLDTDAIVQQGQAFGCDLSDRDGRCEVMLEVTIDFWVKKAKPYLRIHPLNHIGMKGLRQQQREATFKRLEQEGLLAPQSELERIRGEYRRPDRWGVRRWQPPLSLLQNHTIKLRSSGGLETVRLRVPFPLPRLFT